MKGNSQRVMYIDYARGIGILLVMLGHCIHRENDWLRLAIYSFHMPLFFFLSGMTYHSEKSKGAKAHIKISIRNKCYLLIVYLVFSSIYIAKNLVCAVISGTFSIENLVRNVFETISLNGINVLWFLSTLFLVECIFDLIESKMLHNKYLSVGVFSIITSIVAFWCFSQVSLYIHKSTIVMLAQSFLRPLVVFVFFYAGYIFREFNIVELTKIWIKQKNLRICILGAGGGTALYLGILNGFVDINNAEVAGNIVVFLVVGIVTPIVITTLCAEVAVHNNPNILAYLGRNSLFIMVTHNYLGINNLCEKVTYRLMGNQIGSEFLTFCFLCVIEILLVRIVGERVNLRLKQVSVKYGGRNKCNE